MQYSEQLFSYTEADQEPCILTTPIRPEVASFLPQCAAVIKKQLHTLQGLNLSEDDDEVLDTLYRINHTQWGMCKLHGIGKIDQLLLVLDFALDLARSLKTVKVHSIDYLIKLYYEKCLTMVQDFMDHGATELEVGDLLDEGRNYLLKPLKAWNQGFEDARQVFQAQAVHDVPVPIPEAQTPSPKVPSTLEIPFDDEPEPLNVPLDKVGIISDFYEENTEILRNFANGLIELEGNGNPKDLVNDLFRMIHTVKGGARLLNIKKLECLAHSMENLLDGIRHDKLTINSGIVDLLLDGKNALSEMMEETASRGPFVTRIRGLVEAIHHQVGGVAGTMVPVASVTPAPQAQGSPPPQPPAASQAPKQTPRLDGGSDKVKNAESLRVSSEKLDEVLNTASEIFIGRIRFQNEITAIQNFIKNFKSSLQRASELEKTRILAKLDLYIPEFTKELLRISAKGSPQGRFPENRLSELLGQMVTRLLPDNAGSEMSLQEELNLNYLTIEEIQKQLQKNLETLEQLSTRLQNGAMSFRMVPISNLFERFPLQLRDLARTIGKKVKVEIVGGDTELDKVLINKLADPLLHMLRNSIDHGIEMPDERLKAGKPEVGTITLRTYYHGSYAVIEIRDDGRGINLQRVQDKALEKGLIPENKLGKLSPAEIMELVFLPGFSTNDAVTELSGRGVGMDVVKNAIDQLHGTIETESEAGVYTCFKLKLPLTLAIVKILLVKESSYQFALPILNIEALITVNHGDITKIENRLIFNYKGQTIPVASLSTILNFPQSHFKHDKIQMVVLNENKHLTGILVDSVLGRQEILIKSLGRFLKKAPFVMGCTILRDSRLVLILDPRQIVDAVKQDGRMNLETTKVQAPTGQSQHTILIADDSAIQRENLRTILKNTEYHVETAENGFDAIKASRNKTYSAFCVDILMPLMDGYEFVERLRKIPLYENVPVFLITGKEVDAQRVINLGITQVFKKPVEGKELIACLDAALLREVAP